MQIEDDKATKVRFARGLIIETVLMYCAVLAVVRILVTQVHLLHGLAVPAILLTAGLAPCFLDKRFLPAIGIDRKQLNAAFMLTGIACLIAFPTTYFTLQLLASRGLHIPLRSYVPGQEMALAWVFYQLFYVAVSEEVFFRGYVQRNIQHILCKGLPCQRKNQVVAILVSSCAFGLAHFVIFGHAGALLTIFPGLVLGWLYARTNALLAPILFHGLANVFYGVFLAGSLPG